MTNVSEVDISSTLLATEFTVPEITSDIRLRTIFSNDPL